MSIADRACHMCTVARTRAFGLHEHCQDQQSKHSGAHLPQRALFILETCACTQRSTRPSFTPSHHMPKGCRLCGVWFVLLVRVSKRSSTPSLPLSSTNQTNLSGKRAAWTRVGGSTERLSAACCGPSPHTRHGMRARSGAPNDFERPAAGP